MLLVLHLSLLNLNCLLFLWLGGLLPLHHKVLELLVIFFTFLLRRSQLSLLGGLGEFVVVAIEDVLLVQEGVGELFLHRTFAQKYFDFIAEDFLVKQLIDIGPLVWILVQHLVY